MRAAEEMGSIRYLLAHNVVGNIKLTQILLLLPLK